MVIIAGTLIICIGIVFWRLHTSCSIHLVERDASSRMVYYLAFAVISIVRLNLLPRSVKEKKRTKKRRKNPG